MIMMMMTDDDGDGDDDVYEMMMIRMIYHVQVNWQRRIAHFAVERQFCINTMIFGVIRSYQVCLVFMVVRILKSQRRTISE